MADFRKLRRLGAHHGAVLGVVWNKAGTYCVTHGKDGVVRLWNPHRGAGEGGVASASTAVQQSDQALLIRAYDAGFHAQGVHGVCISGDSARFASCGEEKAAWEWDVVAGVTTRKFWGHDSRINAVEYNLDATVLFTASDDRTVRAWDLRVKGGPPIQVLGGFGDSVTSMFVNAHQVVAGSVDGTVRTYDLRAGVVRSDALGVPVTCVSASNDGACVLASCLDSAVRLLESASGAILNTYCGGGHVAKGMKLGSCLSRDDGLVYSGSESDGIVRVWDLVGAGGRPSHTLAGHTMPVVAVACHPIRNDMLLTASVDGDALLWEK